MTRESVVQLRQQSRGTDKSQLLKKCHTRLSRALERYGVLDQVVIDELRIWNRKRNLAVHELVKIRNSSDTDWNARIKFVREAAREGEYLLKGLKAETARIKRHKVRGLS